MNIGIRLHDTKPGTLRERLGCAAAHFENLEEACSVHGIDADALCKDLNDYLESKAN